MSNKPEPNITWDPYIQDVISVYITQKKTAEETIKYLREKHGLEATLSQFHSKFGGMKNIAEKEWMTGIIPAVRKRALEGKDSDVHLYGNKLGLKRLKRGIDRYSYRVSRNVRDFDTSAVIGQNLSDRLCITTPPRHSASPTTNPSLEVDQEVAEVTLPETPAQIPCCTSPDSMIQSSPSRWSYIFLHDGSGLQFVNFDDYPPFPFDAPTAPIAHIPEAHAREVTNPHTPQHSIDNVSALMSTGALSESPFGLDPMLGVSQFPPLVNLPFFQLKYSILQNNMAACSPKNVNHLQSDLLLDSPSNDWAFEIRTIPGHPSNDLPSMLAKVIDLPYNSQVADFIPSIVTKLQALIPELYPGELNAQVQTLSDPSQKPHIFQLFEVTAYFSSNNLLRNDQAITFIKWVIEHNHVESLMLFLRLQRDMLTVQAFLIRLIEAGTCVRNKEFLQQLHAIGAKFDCVAEQLMVIKDPEFLTFVLHTLDPELLKGEPGGRLLRYVARTPHITVAELLINAGAEINVSLSEQVPTAPLWEAVNSANFEMVKCLVRAGADVNKYSAMTVGLTPAAHKPLPLAVWKGDKRVVEYLLDQNVVIEGFVCNVPLLQYAADKIPPVYELLLKKSGSAPKVTVGQLLRAADSDAQLLSEFLSQHLEVSEQMLEEAMVMALVNQKTRAVVNLLQHGVDASGSHLPKTFRCPLYTVATRLYDQSVGHRYIDLLIDANADVNVDGLLDKLVWEERFSSSIIEKMIDAGLDLTRYGPTAIEHAMENEDPDALIFLVNRGVSVNSYGHRVTPFQAAALGQNLELLQYFFERGADINKPPFPIRGYTALQAAAAASSMEKVQFLLSEGAELNAAPAVTGGVTALEATVRPWAPFFEDDYWEEGYDEKIGLTEVFIYLLNKGAVVNRPDGSRSPLLHDIIERRNTHLLKLALEAGANTTHLWRTSSSSWYERTPLQLAAEMGQVEALKLLLYHKADPNASPAHLHGRTALQAAASSETACIETVKLLLDEDAGINAVPAPFGGISALQGAAIKGHFQIALLLIRKGAKVNAPPAIKDGRTAIEGAAEHGRLDIVQMLLNAGAIGDQKAGFMKAISLARQNCHFAVVNLLESQEQITPCP
ncbi:Ankyrin repeat [Fusarium oxysporum f. sp. vasinfectum]|uniref:Clr5 domain-containing protein n=1 Tax=Fusarium oxysporum f. sp. vasinfectum 25433 TaxID=1089449 RepID=X0N0A7_FUSOX|nr:hypothetical protein FOTG_07719 [Fusarium oxysporum f. sp. vasinfectum 25433]KAK2671688.1 Ankyrin repeat [Fusarium oxysporum f. sp. vasinfectum]